MTPPVLTDNRARYTHRHSSFHWMGMSVMNVGHMMVGMGKRGMAMNVGMFISKFPFMVMGVMVIIMGMGMIVNEPFMRVGMLVFIVDEQDRANHHDGQGDDEQPPRQFLEDNE